MGEWNRARSAIHQAPTEEEREQAIDALWKLARQDAKDRITDMIDGRREFLEGSEAKNTCSWLICLIDRLDD